MKKLCVLACLLFGNAFGYPSPKEVGLSPDDIAKMDYYLAHHLCPTKNIGDYGSVHGIDFTCYVPIMYALRKKNPNIEETVGHLFICNYYGRFNGQDYRSQHLIACPLINNDTEETDNE